jgi:triacylglycerol lipase
MGTISPFRYFEVARFLIHHVLVKAPQKITKLKPISGIYKGKSREDNLPTSPARNTYSQALSTAAPTSPDPTEERQPIADPGHRKPIRPDPYYPPEPGDIYRLMNDERLMVSGGVKPPKEIVVLCHGESSGGS